MQTAFPIITSLDALLSVGFGLSMFFFPESTIGTMVKLPSDYNHSLTSALVQHLSIQYCMTAPLVWCSYSNDRGRRIKLALCLLTQHLVIGIKCCLEMKRNWIIGNPWHDIVIHSAFTAAYSAFLISNYKNRLAWLKLCLNCVWKDRIHKWGVSVQFDSIWGEWFFTVTLSNKEEISKQSYPANFSSNIYHYH